MCGLQVEGEGSEGKMDGLDLSTHSEGGAEVRLLSSTGPHLVVVCGAGRCDWENRSTKCDPHFRIRVAYQSMLDALELVNLHASPRHGL